MTEQQCLADKILAELLELKWWDLPWKMLREKVPWLMKEPA